VSFVSRETRKLLAIPNFFEINRLMKENIAKTKSEKMTDFPRRRVTVFD